MEMREYHNQLDEIQDLDDDYLGFAVSAKLNTMSDKEAICWVSECLTELPPEPFMKVLKTSLDSFDESDDRDLALQLIKQLCLYMKSSLEMDICSKTQEVIDYDN